MDPRHEKQTKHWQEVAWTSKGGRSGKAPTTRGPPPPPPPRHHPSNSSNEYEEDHEIFEQHSSIEWSSHVALRYSKKTKQRTINENHEAPVYEGNK
jgi:hypothetical protein